MKTNSAITLLNYTYNLERICASAMRSCRSEKTVYELYNELDEKNIKRLIDLAIRMGHESVLEHGSLTYGLKNVSRVLTHQLVRHRLASYSQQSQRHVKIKKTFGYIKPPKIGDKKVSVDIKGYRVELSYEDFMELAKQVEEGLIAQGVPKEDARYVRPNSSFTNITITANPREFRHIFNLRCSEETQWEIRDVAYAMLTCAKLIAPNIFRNLPIEKSSEYVRNKVKKIERIFR